MAQADDRVEQILTCPDLSFFISECCVTSDSFTNFNRIFNSLKYYWYEKTAVIHSYALFASFVCFFSEQI